MRPSGVAEQEAGIGWYVTDGEPCMAQAKESPEDFVVEERVSIPEVLEEPRAGFYPLYRVEKRSIDTLHMAEELSRALKSRVTYAGLKDKRAVGVQYATPTSTRSERPPRVLGERFDARLVGYVPRPLGRSALIGNEFRVVLRHCCAKVEDRVSEAMKAAKDGAVPNFYGLQRFGTSGAGTHRVGRAMVKGDFQGAVRLLLASGGGEVAEAFDAEDYVRAADLLPGGRDVELSVARELGRRPGDWVAALRAVPLRLRRLYVQAYQSYIFNRVMSRSVERGEDSSRLAPGDNWAEEAPDGLSVSAPRGVRDPPTERAVPMVQMAGYAFRDYGSRFDSLTLEVLGSEGVTPGQFYIEGMQEVSQEGGFRRPGLVVRGERWKVEGTSAALEFILPRGQYATVLLREIVKGDDPKAAGLG